MLEYRIEPMEGLIHVQMSGSNRCADVERHFANVLKDPRYNPALNTIFQITDDAGGQILMELREVGTVIEMLALLQAGRKWAVVMTPGFKRTISEFLLRDVQLGTVQMRFFDREEEALGWLQLGRQPISAASGSTRPADGNHSCRS